MNGHALGTKYSAQLLAVLFAAALPTGLSAQPKVRATIRFGDSVLVRHVAFSPDGKELVSAADGMVRRWDVLTGKEIATKLETTPVRPDPHVLYGPDGKTLLVNCQGVMRLWDVTTGKELRAFSQEKSDALVAAFSPDGKRLAIVSRQPMNGVSLWDPTTGQLLDSIPSSKFLVDFSSLSFSPDGKILTTISSSDNRVARWDVAASKRLPDIGVRGAVSCWAYSPDGKTLALGCSDARVVAKVVLWDLATGRERAASEELSASDGMQSLAYSPDGKMVAGAVWGNEGYGAIKLLDAKTGKTIATLGGPGDTTGWPAFSADGKTLASCGKGQIKLWDAAANR